MKPMHQKTPPHTLHGKEKAQYVAGMFARIARRYDLLNTVMTAGMHHRWRRLTTRLAVEGLEGTALDVATGTGDLAFSLSRRKEVSYTIGVDFVPRDGVACRPQGEPVATVWRHSFSAGRRLGATVPRRYLHLRHLRIQHAQRGGRAAGGSGNDQGGKARWKSSSDWRSPSSPKTAYSPSCSGFYFHRIVPPDRRVDRGRP